MTSDRIGFDYSVPKTLKLKLSGEWLMSAGIPPVSKVISELTNHPDIAQITFDLSPVTAWDSGLILFLLTLIKDYKSSKLDVVESGLPADIRKLLSLVTTSAESKTIEHIAHESFLVKVGNKTLYIWGSIKSLLVFLGEIAIAFGRLSHSRAYFRWSDFMVIIQKCGADALGLVSLISILVGMILAFVGAIQLKMFGAQVFIADIVGIAMVRVMGAVMTGILMSGRTGASFAAELGIMQTNEEIDALRTLGVNPVDFLVVPRILALVIMMPLLTLYADFMGILGGYIISTGMLGINPVEYLNHTHTAVKLSNLWVGLIHSFVFGIIIAISGCLRGINCERSANGVGEATTSAVVTAITSIVIATAIITFVCQILGV